MKYFILAALLLSGCTATEQAQVTAMNAKVSAALPSAQQTAQLAITLYGVDKGLAQVAMLADPALAVVLVPVIAIADPLVAQAQVQLNATVADQAALSALAAQIIAQANQLAVTAAPAIKAVAAPVK